MVSVTGNFRLTTPSLLLDVVVSARLGGWSVHAGDKETLTNGRKDQTNLAGVSAGQQFGKFFNEWICGS